MVVPALDTGPAREAAGLPENLGQRNTLFANLSTAAIGNSERMR